MVHIFRALKELIPLPMRSFVRYCIQHRKEFGRWSRILLGGKPDSGQIQVFYGHDHVPTAGEQAYGGMVKFQRMQPMLPNANRCFNILYMVNNWKPKDWPELLWLARQKRARIVCNQNGVAYPGWCETGWEKKNRYMAQVLHASDYVFYQSQFSKISADHFLGERKTGWEILYNPVDTKIFTPAASDLDSRHVVLLVSGSHSQFYRIETALRTLALLIKQRTDVRLLIAGRFNWTSDNEEARHQVWRLLAELNICEYVQVLGAYTQQEAPALLRKAHILLHTKYNDVCPGLVLEAMACGLPIVYSHSGGVPELVGQDAGIGIPAKLSWEQAFPPAPELLAEAVLQVAERRAEFAEAARQRAVEKFDLQPWLQRHYDVFEKLMSK